MLQATTSVVALLMGNFHAHYNSPVISVSSNKNVLENEGCHVFYRRTLPVLHRNGTRKWVRMIYVANLLPRDARNRAPLSDLTISSKRDACFRPSSQYPSRNYFTRSKFLMWLVIYCSMSRELKSLFRQSFLRDITKYPF